GSDEGGDEVETLAAPQASGVEYQTPVLGGTYYQVSFEGDEEAVAAYLAVLADSEKEVNVQVNGTEYTYTSSFWRDENKYTTDNDPSFGGPDKFLNFTSNQFAEGENTIVIQAEGYEDQTIIIKVTGTDASIGDGSDEGGDEVETLAAPQASEAEYQAPIFGDKIYRVSFEGDEEAVAAYLAVLADDQKNVSVQVNGTEYEYKYSFWNDTSKYTVSKDSSYGGKDRYLDFTEDAFEEGVNTIVIQAEGYEELTIAIKVEGRIASIVDPDDGAEELLKAPEADEISYAYNVLFGSYYRVTFTGISTEELETYLKKLKDTEIAAVTVNGQAYEPAVSLFGSEMSYVISSNPYGESVYLDLTEDGFTADVNEIVIQVEGYEDLTFEVEKESDDEEETLLTSASYGQEEDDAKDETDYAGKPEAGETEAPEEDEKPEEGTETEEGQKPEEGEETEEDEKTGEESNEDKEPEDSDQNSQDQEDEDQNSQKPENDDSSLEEKDDLKDDIQDPEDEADEDGDAEELEAGDGEEESDGEEAEDDSQTPDEETDADEDSQNAEADGDEDADQQ
ncbi:MAG: DUF1533 domain-containing protein, partial [Lachnospiraceae bacterium]|nr:DUF1533 domain-containing protein [Lachnospiraceae bacterium]